MNTQLSMEEVNAIEFEILQHLDSFCKEHKIKYFLSDGTLLGAVRHGGFIPWDDDIDVSMLREDYDRFRILYCTQNQVSKYHLLDYEHDKNYLLPILKLEDSSTLLVERNDRYLGVDIGVNIDIFPLDYVDDDDAVLEKQQKIIDNVRGKACFALQSKHKASGVKGVVANTADMLLSFVGRGMFNNRIIKLTKKFAKTKSDKVLLMSWIYREKTFPACLFSSISEVEFENKIFPAPNDPDRYLTIRYGDYMILPPPEKRVQYHGFQAYRKD